MIDIRSYIEFYQKPKICRCSWHKLDFFNDKDKYNPFAASNKYYETSLEVSDEAYEKLMSLVMHNDLGLKKNDAYAKEHDMAVAMMKCILRAIEDNKVSLKMSSKYLVQVAFAKVTVVNCHSEVSLFFELIGKKKGRSEMEAKSMQLVKMHINSIGEGR